MGDLLLLFLQSLESKDWVTLVAVVIGGGGFVGAIIALLKFRPEAGQILVTTAQGVVIIQKSVIEDLRQEIERIGKGYNECCTREKALQDRVWALEHQAGMHETKG